MKMKTWETKDRVKAVEAPSGVVTTIIAGRSYAFIPGEFHIFNAALGNPFVEVPPDLWVERARAIWDSFEFADHGMIEDPIDARNKIAAALKQVAEETRAESSAEVAKAKNLARQVSYELGKAMGHAAGRSEMAVELREKGKRCYACPSGGIYSVPQVATTSEPCLAIPLTAFPNPK